MQRKLLTALRILITITVAAIIASNLGSAVSPAAAENSDSHPSWSGESADSLDHTHPAPMMAPAAAVAPGQPDRSAAPEALDHTGAAITAAAEQGRYHSIQAAVDAARPGDTIVVKAGIYRERVILDKPLRLQGESGAVLDGGGEGDVLTLQADGCIISGLEVRNSGNDLSKDQAGIKVKSNHNVITQNKLLENLMGIYLYAADENLVRGNVIEGKRELSQSQRGNGVHVWKSDHNTIEGNTLSFNRDALYFSFADENMIANNMAHGQRVGVHYMYSNNNQLSGNVLHDNIDGIAMMNSHNNVLQNNRIFNNNEDGIILKELDDNTITDNLIYNNKLGLFIYNADRNKLTGNLLAANLTGVNIAAGSDYNVFAGNSWEQNQIQVNLTDPVHNRWDDGGRGNYWSDYTGNDFDGNGFGDKIYWQNTLVQHLVEKSPLARLLFNSPALQAISAAERAFPALHPPGVVDNYPLMQPPVNSTNLGINWHPRFSISPAEQGDLMAEHMAM